MDVTFRKLPGRRYEMSVVRAHGPALAPRNGPGYHDHLPHDALHFMVEAEAGLAGGAYGRIAAGYNTIFWPADPADRRRQARREARRRITPDQRADMARSESLAGRCQARWLIRHGRPPSLPSWYTDFEDRPEDPALLDRIADRLDAFADAWHALPLGGSLTLTWPAGERTRR